MTKTRRSRRAQTVQAVAAEVWGWDSDKQAALLEALYARGGHVKVDTQFEWVLASRFLTPRVREWVLAACTAAVAAHTPGPQMVPGDSFVEEETWEESVQRTPAALTIHGFYYDTEMVRKGERPKEGDWPNFLAFRAFVYDTAEEAIQHQIERTGTPDGNAWQTNGSGRRQCRV